MPLQVVLSACSSYFETLFEEHPDKAPIIILKDMKFAHVSQLVNFMYRGEINITQVSTAKHNYKKISLGFQLLFLIGLCIGSNQACGGIA